MCACKCVCTPAHACLRGVGGKAPPSLWSLFLSCAVCAPRDPSPGGVRRASRKPDLSPWRTRRQTVWEGGQGFARCILSTTEDERGPGGPRLCQGATRLSQVRGRQAPGWGPPDPHGRASSLGRAPVGRGSRTQPRWGKGLLQPAEIFRGNQAVSLAVLKPSKPRFLLSQRPEHLAHTEVRGDPALAICPVNPKSA